MPLYTVTTQIGVLSAEAKAKLAAEVTTLHTSRQATPRVERVLGRGRLIMGSICTFVVRVGNSRAEHHGMP
jgi:hypothetical protein